MTLPPFMVILDKGILGAEDIYRTAAGMIDNGVSCIQLRDKLSCDSAFLQEARRLRTITRQKNCVLIINDRADIALASDADGVHLGQRDLPYEDARSILGKDKIIGISTHNEQEARSAEKIGADYIGAGPVFPTKTKPNLKEKGLDIVREVSERIKIPVFFIGGINTLNLHKVLEKGGRAVAVSGAVLNSSNAANSVKAFIDILRGAGHKCKISTCRT